MRVRLLLIAVLVLLLTLLLALALQGFARDVFLVELGRAYWEVRALFESVPQVALWVLLLLALLVMAAKSLFRRRGPPQKRAEEEVVTAGRVLVLTRQIQQASKGDYFKWSLARYLGDLTCEVLAQQERATPEQLRRRLRAGKLDLRPTASPGIQEYLEFGRAPLPATPNGFFSRLRARWGTADQPPASDPTLEGVVEFLEERLRDASGGST
jgi:membrane protein implicated in regulation of membrane protease activity